MLLGLGLLALAYGGFSYTRETEQISVGPSNIPLWAGLGLSIAGASSSRAGVESLEPKG